MSRDGLKRNLKTGLLAVLSVGAGVVLVSAFFPTTYRKISTLAKDSGDLHEALAIQAEDPRQAAQPPEYAYFTKDIKKKPTVSAAAYVVGDLETGEIILEKNADKKYPLASVSKLMTATVAVDTIPAADTILISKQALATEGQNGGFRLNEQVPMSEILYPLLLESSNDAAEAIAMHDDRPSFIALMNKKAADLGLVNTSFEDASGLSARNGSTVADMFKLAKYIRDNKPDLFKITTNKSYGNKQHVWFSNNQFVKEPGYLGGKSGYTDPARQTVVSLFSVPLSRDGARPIGITLLQSADRHKDVENILSYLKKNIFYGLSTEAGDAWVTDKIGAPAEPAEPKEPDFVTLAFAGDIMLDRGVKSSVAKNYGGDYSKLFDKLDVLKQSDIVFANLEGPASDKGADMRNLYSFRMDPSVIPALKGAGIDVVSVANNHVGDWGLVSYIDTLTRLKENEIAYAGGGFNLDQATQPVIVEKYGMKIGYLAFSDVGPNWMKATPESGGLLLASNPKFDEIIENASKQVDYLVVSFHWGIEYDKTHNERQEYLAHRAADDGAKLIIGAHPHVVQDTEVYKNSFIAYSLGNFIFDQAFSADTMGGMLLEIKLGRDGSLSTQKNTVQLNRTFKPDQVILGKEEKVKFQEVQKIEKPL